LISGNVVHFARVLREAGLKVGPDRVLQAMAAIETVGIARRDDVHAALSAVMLDRHEQQRLFDAAFDSVWRERGTTGMAGNIDQAAAGQQALPRRLREALARLNMQSAARDDGAPPARATDFSFSARERLQRADFAAMSADEFEQAKDMAGQMALPVAPVRRRRHERATHGALDLRQTLLRMARSPHTIAPAFTRPRMELPALVVLLDISGSMDRYSRVFLHYAHGLMRRHPHVHVLTFGTRLTDISRCLKDRDPDVALQLADEHVHDWRGGTRIASCLAEFNRHWARRLLGGNAALLLVTDGLDRDEHGSLAEAAVQLRRAAHQIVWLNPLLRFEGFEPRAAGIRALMPNVDRFLPVHNLASLADLSRSLRKGH
jgi:uncharacterized protein with von Willebrand factor type A (vWA) domain